MVATATALGIAACDDATPPESDLRARGPQLAAATAATPGTAPAVTAQSLAAARAATRSAAAQTTGLNPVYSATGKISMSLDACGTNSFTGCDIQVDKPAGATVRAVFAAAATTPIIGPRLTPSEVQLNGTPIAAWTQTYDNVQSYGTYYNHWADVTSLLKATIDAAPAGTVNIRSTESRTTSTDGVILAVVFDDPNVTRDHSVVFLFGGQQLAGDQFFVTLTNPVDKTDPGLRLDMALGISYGFQPSGQYSVVDVNGQRLSTSAGGQDDGQASNGALITVGGLGDLNTNPPPLVTDAGGPRTDDELYDIRPFVNNGDNIIRVDTRNPSNDDNVLFAAFYTTVPSRVDVPKPVAVDVRPGDASNNIILNSKGQTLVSVVLLTTPTFDAQDVDPASATLGDESGFDTPIATQRSRSGAASPAARFQDFDRDGDVDLVMWFDKQQMISNADLKPTTTQLVFLANINPTGKARGVVPVTVTP